MKAFYSILFFFWFSSTLLMGQITGANEVRKGNHEYKLGKFDEAEAHYRKSLNKGLGSVEGEFNLANSLYKQKKYKESAAMFKSIAEGQEDKKLKSKAYYNLGNSLMEMQDYQNGVNAFKNALRNNPEDEEARKNLLYAMSKLKEEEEKKQDKQDDKQDQNKDQDKNKDQNKDKNEEQEKQDKEQQQKQEDQQQKEQDQKEQQQKQQQKQQEMSKEEAQRMLDALNNDEKEIQDKLKKKKVQGNPKTIEKDW